MTDKQNPSFPKSQPIVDLVGAGCHDASWLTQAAKAAIAKADVVIYDDLVDESIVALADAKAKTVYRGKRGHFKSADQQEINDLLVHEALAGNKVVRLKGGDPMIFGRGMEEIAFLKAHGLSVRVLPGISSFYGIPSKEAFGLTKRMQAGGFMVLTAHNAKQPRTQTEWKQIAGFKGTLVFLMGMSDLEMIQQNLIENGMDPLTPCAIFTSPVFTMTKSIKTSLCDLAKSAKENRLKSPGIIAIGGSVASYEPLCPIRIALAGSEDFNTKLQALMSPNMQTAVLLDNRYTHCDVDLPQILNTHPDWFVFTSIHGANQFFSLLKNYSIDLRTLSQIKFACIGTGTAQVFKDHFITPDLVARHADSQSLADDLLKMLKPDESVILFQSAKALPVLKQELDAAGIANRFISLYDFECVPSRSMAADLDYDYLVLPSRTAAKAWLAQEKKPKIKAIVALSSPIAKLLENQPERILISETPSPQAVLKIIEDDLEHADLEASSIVSAETIGLDQEQDPNSN